MLNKELKHDKKYSAPVAEEINIFCHILDMQHTTHVHCT